MGAPFGKGASPRWVQARGTLGPRSGLSLATKAVASQLRVWLAGSLSDSPRAESSLSPLARGGRGGGGERGDNVAIVQPQTRQQAGGRNAALHRASRHPTSPGHGHGPQGLGTRLLQELQGQSSGNGGERWKESRKEREEQERKDTQGGQREKNNVGERNKKIQKETGDRGGEERRGIVGERERNREKEGREEEGRRKKEFIEEREEGGRKERERD